MLYFVTPLRSLYSYRELVWEMSLRELKGITQGSLLGWLWIVVRPLIQTSVYVTLICFVFRPAASQGLDPLSYAVYVLSGMIPWQILTRSIEESPALVRNRMELVKQVIYPVETLPMTSIIVGSAGALMTFLIYVVLAAVHGSISWTWILLPIPVAMLVLLNLGISWLFMIAGVVLKDLREIVSIILSLLVYLSPVVIREDMVGPKLWSIIQLNPLAHVVICFRDVLLGQWHGWSWLAFGGMALVALWLGAAVVLRMKVLINEYL